MDFIQPFFILILTKIFLARCTDDTEYEYESLQDLDLSNNWGFSSFSPLPIPINTTTDTEPPTRSTATETTRNLDSINRTAVKMQSALNDTMNDTKSNYEYDNTNHYSVKTTLLPPFGIAMNCPEEEKPSNIGPYEVPTERDLVLLTIKTLHRLFTSYHQKAMLFLDDVRKIVSATDKVAKKCVFKKLEYKKCVKHVSQKAKVIVKGLTSSLEQERQDVLAFGQNENTICSIQSMKEDPVKLIKILASEEAALEFALPGFLKLLNFCQSLCTSPTSDYENKTKPSRHLTDTDVVIRHFLRMKNYTRILQPRNQVFNIPIIRHKLVKRSLPETSELSVSKSDNRWRHNP